MDEVGFGVQPTAVTQSYSLTPEPKGKKRRKEKMTPPTQVFSIGGQCAVCMLSYLPP
jgi:hypothetical protein